MNKSFILIVVAIIVVAGASYFIFKPQPSVQVKQVACSMEAKLCPDGSSVGRSGPNCEFAACPSEITYITYKNTKYGFNVSLPTSWTGYSIVNGTREVRDVSSGVVVATVPTISIRHPLWTVSVPRQDIPIDIYTLGEWAGIIAGKYSVSAAPIPPSELSRNSQFVFALPARYNFAYLVGFQEVEQIIAGKPLSAFEPTVSSTYQSGISGTVLLGPTCPVERIPPDPQCAPKPYSTSINILKSGSTV